MESEQAERRPERPPLAFARLLFVTFRRRCRPDGSLVDFCYRREAFVHKLLNATALIGFGRVQIAFGIGGNTVNSEELARLTAAVAEAGQDLQILAIHDINELVL